MTLRLWPEYCRFSSAPSASDYGVAPKPELALPIGPAAVSAATQSDTSVARGFDRRHVAGLPLWSWGDTADRR